MLEPSHNNELPPIPGKRYFTIGEVSDLCGVKAHVLRYWEQEFDELSPVKRRGNRRYYQRQDVLTIRQIRSLLYDQGYTIGGAKQKIVNGDGKDSASSNAVLVKQMILLMKVQRMTIVFLVNYASSGKPLLYKRKLLEFVLAYYEQVLFWVREEEH